MSFLTRHKLDIAVAVLLFALAAVGSHAGSRLVDLEGTKQLNVWFQADIDRVYQNMTERHSKHYRTKVHPVFSIATHIPVSALAVIGIDKWEAVRLIGAIAAGLWLSGLFIVMRQLQLARLDSIVFALVAGASAAAMFWTTIPETYVFGSLTIILVMGVTALSDRRNVHPFTWVAVSALSLSMTVTNWMAGILATFRNHPMRQTILISAGAFVVITAIWTVQNAMYRGTQFFLFSPEEADYVLVEGSGGILEKTTVFLVHSMVMPAINFLDNPSQPLWPLLSVQFSTAGSAGSAGLVGAMLWVPLLAFGAWSLWQSEAHAKFRFVILATIGGQLLLHLVYGDETFLYALHWLPLLVLVAAMGTLSRHRRAVLAVATVVVAAAGFNNLKQLQWTAAQLTGEHLVDSDNERSRLAAVRDAYPDADWPRGEGHVLLGSIGSAIDGKGYHEPGGNFSPGFGSFGMSFLFFDDADALVSSSNTVPAADISQRIGDDGMSIETQTPLYTATWRAVAERQWTLRFQPASAPGMKAVLRLGSTGPAGNPVHHVDWDGSRLRINDTHDIVFDRPPEFVGLQDERRRPSLDPASWKKSAGSDDGYTNVLVVLPVEDVHNIAVRSIADGEPKPGFGPPERGLLVDVPDMRFVESLHAQSFHLRMGLIGHETRPGDPANYGITWLRDGAYILTAMARTGDLALAKEVSRTFAINDFFGGFGSEADGPGLAIWAISEVAERLDDPEYDRWLWPHIERKAQLILEMARTNRNMYRKYTGPVIPEMRNRMISDLTLVARPARDGMIVGKMDNHRPIFYVNSTAYLGLTRAAAMARRAGFPDEASRWASQAARIRQAWARKISNHPDRWNRRTAISGLWPSEIAAGSLAEFETILQANWIKTHGDDGGFNSTPEWPYFDVAEAHQWLMIGQPERAWSTLEWFWQNQVSPGLYTWWEGSKEENSMHLWETVRGWDHPNHVTPHYWTAAEIALLQLDMLAYEEGSGDDIVIRIGSGIPAEWLDEPMSVTGLQLRNGVLNWAWDGGELSVQWAGSPDVDIVVDGPFRNSKIVRQAAARPDGDSSVGSSVL